MFTVQHIAKRFENVEDAIVAARRRARREGFRHDFYRVAAPAPLVPLGEVWPSGQVDLTFAGAAIVSTQPKVKRRAK